jgi:hypothetical protein
MRGVLREAIRFDFCRATGALCLRKFPIWEGKPSPGGLRAIGGGLSGMSRREREQRSGLRCQARIYASARTALEGFEVRHIRWRTDVQHVERQRHC